MKKKLVIMVLGGVMVCSLMLAGCGGQGEAPATTESTVQTEAPAATDGSAEDAGAAAESVAEETVSDQEA